MFENFEPGSINIYNDIYFNTFKRIVKDSDDILTKRERIFFEWCNYLLDNTKFKKIVLNYFNNITFESSNRNFKLEINDDYTYTLSYYYNKIFVNNGKCKDYSTSDDSNGSKVIGNFYTLRNWFKKRNYLKR